MKVGSINVFTREGAIEAFKIFQEICYKDASTEAVSVICDVEKDMLNLDLTYQDLEELENEYWQSC